MDYKAIAYEQKNLFKRCQNVKATQIQRSFNTDKIYLNIVDKYLIVIVNNYYYNNLFYLFI